MVCFLLPKTTQAQTQELEGYAWAENIGWISFNCLQGGCSPSNNCNNCGNWRTRTFWATSSAQKTGELISSVYDSQIAAGVAFNVLRWTGTRPADTNVRFQIASSNSSGGPWTYVGYDGTASTWYSPPPAVWIKIDGPGGGTDGCQISPGVACHNNKRYFRYRVSLLGNYCGGSPRVDDVALSWSP